MPGTPIWAIEGIALESQAPAVEGSLAYRILRMYDDTNQPILVYPTLTSGSSVVSSATPWDLGTVTEVVPASTITTDFLVKAVTIESMSKNGVFELVLYSGAGDAEVGRLRFSFEGGFFGNSVYILPGILIAANSRIRAALACSTAGAATTSISIAYRVIP